MTQKDKDTNEIWKVIGITFIVISLMLVGFVVIDYFEIKVLETELYCGDKYLDYEPIFNESSGAMVKFPIGARCCRKIDEMVLDNSTGIWTRNKYEDCFYKPRE